MAVHEKNGRNFQKKGVELEASFSKRLEDERLEN